MATVAAAADAVAQLVIHTQQTYNLHVVMTSLCSIPTHALHISIVVTKVQ